MNGRLKLYYELHGLFKLNSGIYCWFCTVLLQCLESGIFLVGDCLLNFEVWLFVLISGSGLYLVTNKTHIQRSPAVEIIVSSIDKQVWNRSYINICSLSLFPFFSPLPRTGIPISSLAYRCWSF
jgi:hypothetical protein